MNQTTPKDVGEMNAEEFDRACLAATGLRPPKDPRQQLPYIVASTFVLASKAVCDQDLVEAFVVNFLLGQGEPPAGCWERVEKAIGRKISLCEPKPFDLATLLEEKAERDRRNSLFD